jgi:hypothetical protein
MRMMKRIPMMEEMPLHPAAAQPPPVPPAARPEEINEEDPMEAIPKQEVPMPHEVILADAELEMHS